MVDLLNIARDIAKGCQYLEENQFIHRWFTRRTHSAYTPTLALRECTRWAIFLPRKQWTNPKLAHLVLFAGVKIVADGPLRRISDEHSHHNDSKTHHAIVCGKHKQLGKTNTKHYIWFTMYMRWNVQIQVKGLATFICLLKLYIMGWSQGLRVTYGLCMLSGFPAIAERTDAEFSIGAGRWGGRLGFFMVSSQGTS